ncbi:MAG: hypothetical protein KatS3mg068_0860 [Candidatus Sericytochromatia bacterium]|nr:MAG: hypothetical protein KatS3mg068_0860 [Candidatus Sericytochromatia bacterium]
MNEEKKSIRVSEFARIKFSDKTERTYKLEYKNVFRSGDKIGNNTAGIDLQSKKRTYIY